MPYIGRSLGDGVRARYIYAATSGQTTFSGNDANGIALAYSDTLYMDVYQNGVLLKPVTDYASTTGTSVVLTTGASTDDVVEMIVYDSFAVADTVSAANGGTFSGNMAMGGSLGVTGAATLSSTLAVTDDANFDSGTLFVDASANRVGIGTTSPSQLLSIVDTNARMEVLSAVGGTSIIDIGTTSDADAASVRYASGTGAMSFRANGDERLLINSSGSACVGIASEVRNANDLGVSVESAGRIYLGRGAASGAFAHLVFINSNGTVGSVTTSGSTTAFNQSSDYRLKENVDYTWDATTRLKQLKPARFNFIADPDTTVDGFLAHEAATVCPESVTGTKDEVEVWNDGEELPDGISVGDNKLDEDGNTIPVMQGIDQSKLVPLLVKTIQELEARITALEAG